MFTGHRRNRCCPTGHSAIRQHFRRWRPATSAGGCPERWISGSATAPGLSERASSAISVAISSGLSGAGAAKPAAGTLPAVTTLSAASSALPCLPRSRSSGLSEPALVSGGRKAGGSGAVTAATGSRGRASSRAGASLSSAAIGASPASPAGGKHAATGEFAIAGRCRPARGRHRGRGADAAHRKWPCGVCRP